MAYKTLLLSETEQAVILTLHRPERRNALTPEMVEEIVHALDQAAAGAARVLIITGAGKAFCSGMDIDSLRALTSQSLEAGVEDSRRIARMFLRLYRFPKPVIAAVNGAAVAGGCGLATLPDFTLAVPEAQFGYPEARIGFIPAIVSVFLVRQIGDKKARDLLLSGRLIAAEEMRQMGLVSEIVPAEDLLARAAELAAQLGSLSPSSLAFTKKLLLDYAEGELERQLELAVQANAQIRATDDFREGLSAFLEKRKPLWKGR